MCQPLKGHDYTLSIASKSKNQNVNYAQMHCSGVYKGGGQPWGSPGEYGVGGVQERNEGEVGVLRGQVSQENSKNN